jgi:PAS domain S-box-containing protein
MGLHANNKCSNALLIVSSDKQLCDAIKTILHARIPDIHAVEDMAQALDAYNSKPEGYSCVLCDIDDHFLKQKDQFHQLKIHSNIPILAILRDNTHVPALKEILVGASALINARDLDEQLELSMDIALSRYNENTEYRYVYEFSLNGICSHKLLYDTNGKPWDCQYVHVNDAYETVTGLKRDTIIGSTIRSLFPEKDAETVITMYVNALREDRKTSQEIYFEPLDNWFSISVSGAQNDSFTVFVENITERKKAELALSAMEYHFRSIVDSGVALIWTAGTDQKCDYFNQPWLQFTGRALEAELGDGWAEGVHPDDLERCVEIYHTAFAAREKFSMEYRLHTAAGDYKWIQDIGTPRYNEKGIFIGYVGHCIDIDKRKKAEAQLKDKMNELERFTKLTVDRELHMIELKKEVNALLEKNNLQRKYIIHE